MATPTPQPQQFPPSAAKWASILCFSLCSLFSAVAEDFSSLAGTWVTHFNNNVDRVYRIAADGTYVSTDGDGKAEGSIKLESGDFIIEMSDGRIQRITKLADTLIKVEAFGSWESFKKGNSRATGTGRLEQPIATSIAPTPAIPPMPKAVTLPAVVATTPTPAPATPKNKSSNQQKVEEAPVSSRKLTLGASWNTPMQGGSNTMEDLAKLFGGLTQAKEDLSGDDQLIVYQGISYLAPIGEVVATLKLSGRLPSKNPVVCPGFPRASFFTYAFDGRFEEGFNRLYLIVDRADQLMGVQLVEESPKSLSKYVSRDQGWRTYNFVQARTKAVNTLIIQHQVSLPEKEGWKVPRPDDIIPSITRRNEGWKLVKVDSFLAQPDSKSASRNFNLALKEVSRWYVPKPVIELILTCVQKNSR